MNHLRDIPPITTALIVLVAAIMTMIIWLGSPALGEGLGLLFAGVLVGGLTVYGARRFAARMRALHAWCTTRR